MIKPTKHQIKTAYSFYNNNSFKCPSCKTETLGFPAIENSGEDKTQVYCHYGCGYIFLEDYLKPKQR